MEYTQKPKIKFPTNVPVIVKLLWDKPRQVVVKRGTPEESKENIYTVELDGVEHEFWGNERLDKELALYPKGASISILKKEVQQEGKKPYIVWEVKQHLFDESGARTKEKAEVVQGKIDSRAERMANCLKDAITALLSVPELKNAVPEDKREDAWFTMEDVRAIAISLYIEESKIR